MSKGYRRSRTDYPDGVLGVYDNGGKTADRYTVVYEPYVCKKRTYFPVTDMSPNPFWPQGVCLHNSFPFRPVGSGWGHKGQGRLIAFEALPKDCQRAARQDLEEMPGLYEDTP